MTDIVERLRIYPAIVGFHLPICDEAAAEIERLHADLRIAGEKFAEVCDEIERLRDALEQALDDMSSDGLCVCQDTKTLMIAAMLR